jgi:hypothetical protein
VGAGLGELGHRTRSWSVGLEPSEDWRSADVAGLTPDGRQYVRDRRDPLGRRIAGSPARSSEDCSIHAFGVHAVYLVASILTFIRREVGSVGARSCVVRVPALGDNFFVFAQSMEDPGRSPPWPLSRPSRCVAGRPVWAGPTEQAARVHRSVIKVRDDAAHARWGPLGRRSARSRTRRSSTSTRQARRVLARHWQAPDAGRARRVHHSSSPTSLERTYIRTGLDEYGGERIRLRSARSIDGELATVRGPHRDPAPASSGTVESADGSDGASAG